MTDHIAGLPFWELTFDAHGDPDTGQRDTFLTEVAVRGITDLVVFAHGWNTDQRSARGLYDGFFGLLAGQLQHAKSPVTVGLAGVLWPSQRWSDEPIPDFTGAAAAGGGGAASLADAEPAAPGASSATLDAQTLDAQTLDAQTLATLRELFPAAVGPLDEMALLLEGPATDEAQARFHTRLAEFSQLAGATGDDGEGDRIGPDPATGQPRMLLDDHTALFERYRDTLLTSGVQLDDGGGDGLAGIGDTVRGIWNGAKEALRQATYWQMKNRAGTVGQTGLGPVIGQLHAAAPTVRVHLVGHSFGARLVSYALAGVPADLAPSPVKAVTLLQGAFSHFAFAKPHPFDARRNGALAGMLARIDGPLTVCFSTHDGAVGTFYPLASIAAREDAAASQSAMFRWGGMGADGAQGVGAALDAVRPAGPGNIYPFARGAALNVDASEVVRTGGPPTGAHSDIVHPELTWVVLSAGGVV